MLDAIYHSGCIPAIKELNKKRRFLCTAQVILRQGEKEYYTALAKSSNPYIKELVLMTLYEPALKILAKNYLHDVTAWRAYAYLKTGKLPPAR